LTLRPYRGLKLLIYRDPKSRALSYDKLSSTLEDQIPECEVELREDYLAYAMRRWRVNPKETAARLASLRVVDILRCEPVGEPLIGEIAYEERVLQDPSRSTAGILYEGYLFQSFLHSLIPVEERRYGLLHTVLTSRLLVTKEEGEGRAHARTIMLGNPAIISTTGLVEAPALPPEVYMGLWLLSSPDVQRLAVEEERRRLGDMVLSYDDERMTSVVVGYVLQVVFYYLFGEAFCTDPSCRLYNSHTHEELIRAQIKSGGLCHRHQSLLRGLG